MLMKKASVKMWRWNCGKIGFHDLRTQWFRDGVLGGLKFLGRGCSGLNPKLCIVGGLWVWQGQRGL